MPFLFTYLLKLSVSLAVVFLFYKFVLRKLTFYNWNRLYLLSYTLLCFLIPFIDISPVLQRNEWNTSTAVTWIPVIGEYKANEIVAAPAFSFFTPWNIISLVVVAGMLIMFLRLLIQLISFRKMMKKAKAIPCEDMDIYQVDEEIIPFSFGNSIFINQHLHTTEELQEIIRHEFVHVKQKHSIDIIWGELLCLVNWFNPFAWLIRKSIRQNLEFIADSKVLENGINKKQYQYLLLKVIGNNQFSIAPKFNFSSLKKRIAMMNKLKTARLHLVRFLFIVPLLAVILISFRQKKQNTGASAEIYEMKVSPITDTVPAIAGPNEKGYIINVKGYNSNCTIVIKDKNGKEVEQLLLTKWNENEKYYKEKYGEIPSPPPPTPEYLEGTVSREVFLKHNSDVENTGWVFHHDNTIAILHITKKDGSTESYNLDNEAEREKFERKYGKIPYPPTPPTPPVLLKLPDSVQYLLRNAELIEIWVEDGKKESYNLKVPAEKAAFEKKYGKMPEPPDPPTPPAPPTKGSNHETTAVQEVNRSVVSDEFEITDKKATMHLKNGKIEVYDLTNTTERKNFETKYGKLISVPAKVEGAEVAVTAINTETGRTVIAPVKVADEGGVLFLNDEGNIITGEEEILVTITKRTTREQLDGFVKQMKEKGFELKFDNIRYDNGILVRISGTIKYKDGQGSFSETDFNKLIISGIKYGDRFHLKIDTRVNKT